MFLMPSSHTDNFLFIKANWNVTSVSEKFYFDYFTFLFYFMFTNVFNFEFTIPENNLLKSKPVAVLTIL